MIQFRTLAVYLAALALSLHLAPVTGWAGSNDEDASNPMFDTLEWRNIGPARGGRSVTVAGVPGDPLTYYFGGTGGGVWKTTNAGTTWTNVSDDQGFGTGSVGSIAVAESDPNVVYVGMGEADIRGNFSHGDGVYKSTDAGKTWTHIGLEDTRQIGRIQIHPTNPDVVYVAALGHVFGPNEERGVFRSTDGGTSWEKVLYVNDETGAVDVRIDPLNPRNVFAGFWQVNRTPWDLSSGGEGSGLYRSTDGGETWDELTDGLPEGIKGKISVSPSAAQRDLVYAMVEADDGGVFRSDDGGDTWRRTNQERNLRQRAWYYTHIYADTQDAETVYVMNVRFHKSIDGGKSFSSIGVPHGDNHDLWIAPENNKRIVNANDGGANVSFDGGDTWSRQDNQPTAQFYHVTVDNRFPYRVYGAQQDNSTASVSSRGRAFGNWQRDFYAVGGGESGYIAVHPENPDIVYAGSYSGYLTRYDHATRTSRNVTVWPENPMGSGAEDHVYRFQWTFPIVISQHDPSVLYVAGNVLFKSTDEGGSFTPISPDLTSNDKSKQGSSGGPITKDNTGVEYYCTIFAVAESPLQQGMIWAGSDDGLVHLTTDEGANWQNVTPSGMGDWPMISIIEASSHDIDTAYLAVNRYKMDDFKPYIYRTRDRGRSWDLVVNGIADDAFVRTVREDPVVPGILYAGTETGVWVSRDDGDNWEPLQQNLPVVPITDLVVKDDDLVVATQGRSFWILDDVTPLRQMRDVTDGSLAHLFAPSVTYRQRWDSMRTHYSLRDDVQIGTEIRLAFLTSSNELVREFKGEVVARDDEDEAEVDAAESADTESDSDDESDDETAEDEAAAEDEDDDDDDEAEDSLEPARGMSVFSWNMRLKDPVKVPGAVGWPRTPSGPRVPPGQYLVRLTVGEDVVLEQAATILGHPEIPTTIDEYQAQYDLLTRIHNSLSEAHEAVNTIRSIRAQVKDAVKRSENQTGHDSIKEAAKTLNAKMKEIEETILQTKSKSPQDPLNFPVRLNDKIGALQNTVDNDYPPTRQAYSVFKHLRGQLEIQLDALEVVLAEDVPAFNRLVHEYAVPAIVLEDESGV